MKASEMIEQLQILAERYGDLEVKVCDDGKGKQINLILAVGILATNGPVRFSINTQ